jgi:hypothetical protein
VLSRADATRRMATLNEGRGCESCTNQPASRAERGRATDAEERRGSRRAFGGNTCLCYSGVVPYEIRFADCVHGHLAVLTAAERVHVLDAIGDQLGHQPLIETRNRKPLRPNPIAPWELRAGPLRVFYDVVAGDAESKTGADVVYILAVGKKQRNVLRIAGEVVGI